MNINDYTSEHFVDSVTIESPIKLNSKNNFYPMSAVTIKDDIIRLDQNELGVKAVVSVDATELSKVDMSTVVSVNLTDEGDRIRFLSAPISGIAAQLMDDYKAQTNTDASPAVKGCANQNVSLY